MWPLPRSRATTSKFTWGSGLSFVMPCLPTEAPEYLKPLNRESSCTVQHPFDLLTISGKPPFT